MSYKLIPELKAVLDKYQIAEPLQQSLVDYLVNQSSSYRGQIDGMKNNAISINKQAEEMETTAQGLAFMVAQLTVEVPDPVDPAE